MSADDASAFRVIGYFPSWQGSVSGIQFGKVTHVNYAFGKIDAANLRAAHARIESGTTIGKLALEGW